MIRVRIIVAAAGAWLLSAAVASAQATPPGDSAAVVGAVHRDTTGLTLVGAHVVLPQLRRETVTNARGEFRIEALPAGRFVIVVRGLGFAPRQDTIVLVAGQATTRDFVLTRLAELDSVTVTAPATRYISPAERGFEERRRRGVGRFLAEEDLREHHGRSLATVIAQRIPGVRAIPTGSGTFLASSRSASGSTGRAFERRSPAGTCWVSVYLDGALVYDGSQSGASPPNFDRFQVSELAAIEFYGDATAPPEFRRTSSGCGTLILWARERDR